MIIGTFRYDAATDIYEGEIRTLTLPRQALTIRPNERSNDREPDYRIFGTVDGGEVEFGAAWRRETDRGRAYLSVLLDDPAFGMPLNVALFTDRGDVGNLVWSRPQRQAPTEPQPRPARGTKPAQARRATAG